MVAATRKPVIAIAGNPNSGKTALFNGITGARQHVGNWPGVTVEKKTGSVVHEGVELSVVDLPGTYSFSSSAIDETIARDFILWENPDAVINVVDTTNLERHLYLTVQILEMGAPVILALNIFDEAKKLGIKVNLDKLEARLRTKVVPTVAIERKGIPELLTTAIQMVKNRDQGSAKFTIDYGPAVEREIAELSQLLDTILEKKVRTSTRWFAIKLLEHDDNIRGKLFKGLADEQVKQLETRVAMARSRIQQETGQDPTDLIAEKRYALTAKITKETTTTPEDVIRPSTMVDRILLNKWLAYPLFLVVMLLMFQLTFTLSDPIVEWLGGVIQTFSEWVYGSLTGLGAPEMLVGFLTDGILGGLGAVFEFAPPIFFLFWIITLLEDVGYIARAAVLSDRLMRSVGLHGKAFIPMILGFGCNVTGILATRNLDDPKDRLISILVNPLISCSARLPVYVLFASAFFPKHQGIVVFSLYVLGVVLAAVMAKIFSLFIKSDSTSTFVIELPPYRLPRLKDILIQTWERAKHFLERAGTVIFISIIVVWVLSNLPPNIEPGSPDSLIARIGGFFAPIFKPAGFGTWQASTALIFGALAKELILGTLAVLYGAGEAGLAAALQAQWTPLSAYAFLVMSLIYIPCVATIGAIRQETNSRKWTFFAVGYTLFLGWLLAVVVYQVGSLLGFA